MLISCNIDDIKQLTFQVYLHSMHLFDKRNENSLFSSSFLGGIKCLLNVSIPSKYSIVCYILRRQLHSYVFSGTARIEQWKINEYFCFLCSMAANRCKSRKIFLVWKFTFHFTATNMHIFTLFFFLLFPSTAVWFSRMFETFSAFSFYSIFLTLPPHKRLWFKRVLSTLWLTSSSHKNFLFWESFLFFLHFSLEFTIVSLAAAEVSENEIWLQHLYARKMNAKLFPFFLRFANRNIVITRMRRKETRKLTK